MSAIPDHGLRIKTPPPDIDDEDENSSRVYHKALNGFQRAERCRIQGPMPYIYVMVILMIATLKLSFNQPITPEDALLTLCLFAIIYIIQILSIVICTHPIIKNAVVEYPDI